MRKADICKILPHTILVWGFLWGITMNKLNTRKLVITALFCAIAYVCVFVFRIHVAFLTFDAKDAFIAVCSLLYGPVSGTIVSVTVSVLEFLTVSSTGVYGLIMNILSTLSFVLPSAIIYKFKKTSTGAIFGLLSGVCVMTAVMVAANLLITPFYMGTSVNQVIDLLLPLIIPFNFTKAILNASLTMLMYKPIVNALRKAKLVPQSVNHEYKLNKKTIIIIICSVVLIALAVIVLILAMNGTFNLYRNTT